MEEPIKKNASLKLEQQLELRVFQEKIKNLNRSQLQEFLVELFRQMMLKDNLIKTLFLKKL
ncbi:MAG: NblA/ycf18 family protein [Prochloraceae cyanobacterium]|nr:NblA/ycf18 family protein [Prochloraceae cyanobacterium]